MTKLKNLFLALLARAKRASDVVDAERREDFERLRRAMSELFA